MKFEKKILTLASVAGALLVILVASLVFSPRYDRSGKVAKRLIENSSLSEVGMIEVSGRASLVVERQGDSWFVKVGTSRYPAKAERVQDFLSKAFDIAEMAYMGSGEGAWEGFGLSPANAARVTIKTLSGTVVGDFHAGSRDLLNQGVYVRLEGSDESYVAPSGFSTYLESYALAPAQWEDARVLPGLDSQSVSRISLKGRLERVSPAEGQDPIVEVDYILESKGGEWVARGLDGVAIDAEKVKAYLGALASYNADEYVEPAEDQGLAKPSLTLSIGYYETVNIFTGARNVQPDTVIDIGKGSSGSFYIAVRGKGHVLKTSQYGVSQIAKEFDHFKLAQTEAAK